MKKIIMGMLVAGILLCSARELYAQRDCANPTEAAHDEFKRAEAVFVGEVASVKQAGPVILGAFVEFDVTFRVMEAWKKDLPESLTVRSAAVKEVGLDFKEKRRYLIYVYPYKNMLWASIGCYTRTRLLTDAAKDMEEFRLKGEKPKRIIKVPTSGSKAKPNNSFNASGNSAAFIRQLGCLFRCVPPR